MPVEKLKWFLDKENVKYTTISHSRAYTAQEIAHSAHIPGKELAKTVLIKIDGTLAMAVLHASYKVDLERLRAAAGAAHVELASEQEFRDRFSDCEPGAMPPFGNLYGMEVYVERNLAEDSEIVFSAGSHSELMRLAYEDFARLASPRIAGFGAVQA